MSGILKRTIFVGEIPVTNGEVQGQKVKRFADFASVVTGIGQCVEPFTIHDLIGMGDPMPASYDPKDMMRRVDDIRSSQRGDFADGDRVLHAYDQWLRVGP